MLFDYDLITYRSITFIFFLLQFFFLAKYGFEYNKIIFISLLLISSNYTLYVGAYVGYVFSSLIYLIIIILLNKDDEKNYNKVILFLLFVLFYNHLVNLYFVIPILVSLFFTSKKLKFINNFLIYFLLPSCLFYMISTILTGVSLLKVKTTNLDFILNFIFSNFAEIFTSGFERIFFYEAYANASSFKITQLLSDIFYYDKLFLFFFLFSIISAFLNLKYKYYNIKFTYIIFFHFFIFFLINKQPAPRIFSGFYIIYVLIFIFTFRHKHFEKLNKNKIIGSILSVILFLKVVTIDYKQIANNGFLSDITYKENNYSLYLLKKKCKLVNIKFSEIQKRNFYFNYINKCKKKFLLEEFLEYYRS